MKINAVYKILDSKHLSKVANNVLDKWNTMAKHRKEKTNSAKASQKM